jgi:AcrR family transcriptional regulator
MAERTRGERALPKDRRGELVRIAYRHIAEKGFEGLRVHDVAGEAGITNATLHYYFPTKEALIQGVVEYLIHEFSLALIPPGEEGAFGAGALADLRLEFQDALQRLHTSRHMFVVFTELLVRSLRDPDIARIFGQIDAAWHEQLVALLKQGIQEGVFRPEIDVEIVAKSLMAVFKGLGFQMLGEKDLSLAEKISAELSGQVESWLTIK